MYTGPITPELLRRSVIAVPPLARDANLEIVESENATLIRHIEAGGVSNLLYGGNANLFHCRVSEYQGLLEILERSSGKDTWVIPSVGPAWGMAMDQASLIAETDFPSAMLLPMQGAVTSDGVIEGAKRLAGALGKPAILYIRQENYVYPDALGRLVDEGTVACVKYAVARGDPSQDEYLSRLVGAIDPKLVVSGIGEQPAIAHMREFGLAGFTAGLVCLTPERTQRMLRRIQDGDFESAEAIRSSYEELEGLRNAINPIRALHEMVTLSGIADMGPQLPLLSGLSEADSIALRNAIDRFSRG